MNKIRILIDRLIDSYQESNHDKHFATGLLLALFGTFILALYFAIRKEKHDANSGGLYDRSDIYWTLFGAFFGQVLQVIIICLIFKTF